MKGLIRSIVSLPKYSYTDAQDIKYDLAYVSDNVIVGSGPVNSSFKKWYRYPIEDLVKVLSFNHSDHWHIWNLRGEGMGYNEDDVDGKVSYCPFPDHQAPPFFLLIKVVQEVHDFLAKNTENVALIHCKAGKGRSGTLVCAVIMYEALQQKIHLSATEVNQLYTLKRMKPGSGLGVSIKSQIQYLEYWERYISNPQNYLDLSPKVVPINVKFGIVKLHDTLRYLTKANGISLQISIEEYVPREDVDTGAQLGKVWEYSTSDGFEVHENCVTITMPEEAQTKGHCDFRILINGVIFTWFNVCFETPSLKTEIAANKPVLGEFTVNFDHFDGFKGTKQKGSHLFTSLSVNWEISSINI